MPADVNELREMAAKYQDGDGARVKRFLEALAKVLGCDVDAIAWDSLTMMWTAEGCVLTLDRQGKEWKGQTCAACLEQAEDWLRSLASGGVASLRNQLDDMTARAESVVNILARPLP